AQRFARDWTNTLELRSSAPGGLGPMATEYPALTKGFLDAIDKFASPRAQIVITVGDAQARKLAESRAKLAEVQHVISAAPLDDLHGDVLLYDRLIANAGDADVAEYRRRSAEVNANQLVTIIYTSGTTGEPKGVMLNHS